MFVNVSTRDLNRIAIEGGKVRRIKAADDSVLTGSADQDTGQALVQPLVKDPFGIFVFSQTGKTYTLVLQPKDKAFVGCNRFPACRFFAWPAK